MSQTAIIVAASAVLVVLLAVAYSVTKGLKKRIDDHEPLCLGPPFLVVLSEESTERLSALSTQPIFVKQGSDGTRVQIENRPLVPVVMLTDQEAVRALREVVMAVSNRIGAVWTAVVSVQGDDGVSVQRLS